MGRARTLPVCFAALWDAAARYAGATLRYRAARPWTWQAPGA